MSSILIYGDTSIWNQLCAQNVDSQSFLSDMALGNAQFVLGTNVVYEMAKTFRMQKKSARQRGQALFSHLEHFVRHRVPALRRILAADRWRLVLSH